MSDQLTAMRWANERKQNWFLNARYGQADGVANDELKLVALGFGATYPVNDRSTFSVGLGLASNKTTTSTSKIESMNYTIAAGYSYEVSNVFLDIAANVSINDYGTIHRDLDMGSIHYDIKASTDGYSAGADVLFGYRLELGGFSVSPSIGYNAVSSTVSNYREGSNFYEFSYLDQSQLSGVARAGVLFDFKLGKSLTLFGDVYGAQETQDGWQHIDVTNNGSFSRTYNLPTMYVSGDTFVTASLGLNGKAGSFDVQAEVRYDDRWTNQYDLMFSIKQGF